jgi:NAD(P)H-nitrite reductase large subunit
MNRWKCQVCGFVHEGDEPPEFCPICDARQEEFELIEESLVAQPSADVSRVVIIGNGAAGIEAARAVRKQLEMAEIFLFSREPYPFYSRLFLTSYLAGQKNREELFVYPDSWYEEHQIRQFLGQEVTEIIPEERKILTQDDVCRYDRLILCLGASAFRPPLVGEEKDGVFTLRSLDDADRILEYLPGCSRVAVIGGGVLGLEIAAAFAKRGLETHVFELSRRLMPRQLDESGSAVVQRLVEERGIVVHLHADVVEIEGGPRVEGVRLRSGERIPVDLVVLSVGIWPEVSLAEEAGLQVKKGIVVNDYLQTSDPAIYAAGDAVEHRGRIYGLWLPSVEQGRIAGINAGGQSREYKGSVVSTVLKVLDLELSSLGQFQATRPGEEEVIWKSEDGRAYRKLVHADGRLLGGIFIGDNRMAVAAEMLMKRGTVLPESDLQQLKAGDWNVLDVKRRKLG